MKAKKKSSQPAVDQKQGIKPRLIYLFLILVSSAIYFNTLDHDYTLDDAIVITENAYTKKGFSGLADIFTHDAFKGFFQQEGKDRLVSGGRYRPLSQAMFAMEYGLFGLRPWIGHFGNVLWYVFTVCSIFFIVGQVTIKYRPPGVNSMVFAATVALIFACHPIHTEAVANIKGRDEILVLFGGLWSLFFAYRYLDDKKIYSALWSGFFMFLALLAKENAIAFLVVIPLTVYFFRSKNAFALISSITPALLASVLYLVIRFSVLGTDTMGDVPRELMNNPFLKLVDGFYEPMTLDEKGPLIIFGLLKYGQLLFFPHPLTHDYYPKVFGTLSWNSPSVIFGILMLLALFLIVFLRFRSWKLTSYAILFFGVTIFLTSNILFPVGTHLSERFLFTPSLAFSLLLGSFFCWLNQKFYAPFSWVLLSLLIIGFGVKTVSRNEIWKNNYTLFTTDVKTSPSSAKVQNATGGEMIAQAIRIQDTLVRNAQLREAVIHLQKAIEIHPGYKNAFLLSGNAFFYLKDYIGAIKYYDYSLQLDPTYPEAIYNRALAHRDFGRFQGEVRGNLAEAIQYLEKAYPHLQDDYEMNRLLGIAYGNQGQAARAIPYFRKALSLKTDDAWTNYNLGLAYLAIQDSINANYYIGRARTLNPEIGK